MVVSSARAEFKIRPLWLSCSTEDLVGLVGADLVFSAVDGPAPAVDADEIAAVDGFTVDPAVAFRLIDMEFVEADDAHLIELRDRDRRMGSAAAAGRKKTIDL